MTHRNSFLHSVLLVGALLAAPALIHAAAPAPAPAKKGDTYPLKTCVVSGEALGSMGDFVNYVHKEPGKPDRVVRFCCEGCIDDFKKEPAKYLKKIDDAAAAKADGKAPAAKKASK
jgi:hypothetical protein